MKMREQSGKGGFLSKIQFNARKSSTFPFTVKMGSRNRSPRCRNRHANFTFRLSLFRPSVLYTDQRYKSGTKSSRFERGESSFRCSRLTKSLLSTYLSPTPIGFECTLLNRARAFYAVFIRVYVCMRGAYVQRVHQASQGSCMGPGGLCNYRKSKIEGRKRGGSSAGLCFPQTASYYVI